MGYFVTRQNGFYDEGPRIEIALGRDEISPGQLVARYPQEGEYDSATDAAQAALSLRAEWGAALGEMPALSVSAFASVGYYPTAGGGWDAADLGVWAHRRDEADAERDAWEASWPFDEDEED